MNDLGYEVSPEETQDIPLRSGALDESFILLPVSRLMHKAVGTASKSDTVMKSVKQMVAGHYGCVVVVDDGRLTGIFSERDLMLRVVDQGLSPLETTVGEVMTQKTLVTVSNETDTHEALALMVARHIRHLPVVERDGKVAGLLSIRNLLHHLVEELKDELNSLEAYFAADGPGG